MSLLDPELTFASLAESVGLDIRLRKAVARLGHVRPTLVQSKSLPLAISSGRDLLVRARTGSGKTLAYCLPLLQKLLHVDSTKKSTSSTDEHVRAIVLVPTRELCSQVFSTLQSLMYYCDEVVSAVVLSGGGRSQKGKAQEEIERQEAMLRDRPDVIVATPAGLLTHIRSGILDLKSSVETLVVDEADLVLSFGYANDIAEIMKSLPNICQGFLMSATLSHELNSLKKVVLHSPAVLKLEEEADDRNGRKDGKLMQFYLELPKKDKNLVLYVFLKLGLLRGKGLFFVNTTDAGYRLKLFLEQFHVRSAVLNAELPFRSRLNIQEQFNVGNFDYLIATDESADAGGPADDGGGHGENKEGRERKGRKKDSEYGVSRGLDFRNVSFVVNFDFPPTTKSYTHRIGRTARGGAKGVALSLVEEQSTEQQELLHLVQEDQPSIPVVSTGNGMLHAAAGSANQDTVSGLPQPAYQFQPSPLDFDLGEIEGFRYRVEDVSRAVTRTAVRETRAAELRAEILNSERLQSHFNDNPADLQILRHDRVTTHVSKVQDHLKHVPTYMLPRGMQVADLNRKRRKRHRVRSRGSTGQRRTDNDPLQSYEEANASLDGVANDSESQKEFADFFNDGDNRAEHGKRQKVQATEERNIFVNTSDGTGKSTAGRNAWKEKHKKGKFSRKQRKGNRTARALGL